MKSTLSGLGMLLFTAAAFGASASEDYAEYLDGLYKDTVPVVQPEELEQMLNGGRESGRAPIGSAASSAPAGSVGSDELIVLDVRSVPERSVSLIDGSRFVDYESFKIDPFLDMPRDTRIVTYCAVGFRSERIGEMLLAAGFTNVSHLYGGIIEWHNRGLPLHPGPPVHGHSPRWGRYVEDGRVTYQPEVN